MTPSHYPEDPGLKADIAFGADAHVVRRSWLSDKSLWMHFGGGVCAILLSKHCFQLIITMGDLVHFLDPLALFSFQLEFSFHIELMNCLSL